MAWKGRVKNNLVICFFPLFQRGKRISKVRVLQKAIDYIRNMREMVNEHDGLPPVDETEFTFCLEDDQLFAF